ncbi:MAG TPA: hypothetical protein VIK95_12745 [Egibacteraceae bacterium]
MAPRSPRRARLLLVVLAAVIVVASLYPFTPDPPRLVTNQLVRADDGSLRFTPPSRAITPEPPAWLPAAAASDALAVMLEARSDDPSQGGPARLLTVSRDYRHANLQIGQEGEDLVVRLRRPGADAGGDPWFAVDSVFDEAAWRRIEVDVAPGAITISVDGRQRLRAPLAADALAGWDTGMRLALGDEVVGQRGWSGTLRTAEVRVGATAVDYLAPGALEVPERWWLLPERLREPVDLDPLELAATIAHAVTFLALGLVLVRAREARGARTSVARVAGAATLFAVVLLVVKVGVGGRHPAVHDVAVQGASAAVGAWWALRRARRAARGGTGDRGAPLAAGRR